MKIAFLGDSLTEGSPGSSFFALLRDELLPGHELINLGCAGDTVGDLAQRVRAVDLEPVDMAFIWVGVNDAFVAGWQSLVGLPEDDWWEATLAYMSALYDGLLEWTLRRAATVVCVPPFLADFGGDDEFARRTEDVACLVRSVTLGRAAEPGSRVRLFDLAGALAASRSTGELRTPGAHDPAVAARDALDATVTIDGVHLNDRGARLVAEALARAVTDIEGRQRGR